MAKEVRHKIKVNLYENFLRIENDFNKNPYSMKVPLIASIDRHASLPLLLNKGIRGNGVVAARLLRGLLQNKDAVLEKCNPNGLHAAHPYGMQYW